MTVHKTINCPGTPQKSRVAASKVLQKCVYTVYSVCKTENWVWLKLCYTCKEIERERERERERDRHREREREWEREKSTTNERENDPSPWQKRDRE